MIDVDPELKRALYVALAMSGSTLKDWFVKQAVRHCAEVNQPSLFPGSEPSSVVDVSEKTLSQERHQ